MIKLRFVDAGNDPGSEAIKIFERGWCSHVDIVYPDGSLLGARSDEVGGKPRGVQLRPADYEKVVKAQVVSLSCSDEQLAAFYTFLNAQISKPYDKTAIMAFAIERDWQKPDSWFCSELAAAALVNCGWFPKPPSETTNHITPRDLLLMVSPWAAAEAPTG